MERREHPDLAMAMLLLGQLDGRLLTGANADIFLSRARLEGARSLAGLASVPIEVRDLQDWITGRSPPPRASEGLNDPISVAALFHLAISRDEDNADPIHRATLNVLRTVLDDRAEAEAYGREDLAHFGPMWRTIRDAADGPFSRGDLREIAQRVFDLTELTKSGPADGSQVVTADGRTLELPPRQRDRNWLIAAAVPRMLHRAGLTMRVIPSLTLLPKFLPSSPDALTDILAIAMLTAVEHGLRDLDRIDREATRLVSAASATKRSRAPLLARLQIAYPGLQPKAVARLLGVSPQGARKLLLASSGTSRPVLV